MALVVTPLILVGVYFYAVSDIGAEPNPFPDPWLDLAVGTAVSFVIALICASLVTTLKASAACASWTAGIGWRDPQNDLWRRQIERQKNAPKSLLGAEFTALSQVEPARVKV